MSRADNARIAVDSDICYHLNSPVEEWNEDEWSVGAARNPALSPSQALLQRGIPRRRLSLAVDRFVELYLDELTQDAALAEAAWLDGREFARQIIDQNRLLFVELARL